MIKIGAASCLLLVYSLISLNAHCADPGLEGLKSSFAGLIQSSDKEFTKAAQMKPVPVPLGTEISKDECLAIEAKIAPNYKVNPFEFTFEGGSSVNQMCGGRWGWLKNYIVYQAGSTNMGLPYVMIVQLVGPNDYWEMYRDSISNFFIDSSFHVVEVQGLSSNKQTHEILGYGICSVDPNGNIYTSEFEKNYSISPGPAHARDVSGTFTMEKFIPADGSVPGALTRMLVKNEQDPSKDYQVLSLARSDQYDWQDFMSSVLFIGSYYNYGGKYYSYIAKPTFKSTVTIKSRGGKEYCSYGTAKADQKWTDYPADQTAYYNCLNF